MLMFFSPLSALDFLAELLPFPGSVLRFLLVERLLLLDLVVTA